MTDLKDLTICQKIGVKRRGIMHIFACIYMCSQATIRINREPREPTGFYRLITWHSHAPKDIHINGIACTGSHSIHRHLLAPTGNPWEL